VFWYIIIIIFFGLLIVVYGTTIAVSVVEPFLALLLPDVLLGMCIACVRLGQDFIFVSKLVTRYMQLGRLVGL
jgi:TRAP-type C4-dicarboxylate transport system permease large subunit